MMQHFKVSDVTAVATLDTPHRLDYTEDGGHQPRLATLADTLLSLAIDFEADPPRRLLRAVKVRGSDHSLVAHPFVIDDAGLRIEGSDGA